MPPKETKVSVLPLSDPSATPPATGLSCAYAAAVVSIKARPAALPIPSLIYLSQSQNSRLSMLPGRERFPGLITVQFGPATGGRSNYPQDLRRHVPDIGRAMRSGGRVFDTVALPH